MEVRVGTLNLGAKNTKGEINSSQRFLLSDCMIVTLCIVGLLLPYSKNHLEAIVVCI